MEDKIVDHFKFLITGLGYADLVVLLYWHHFSKIVGVLNVSSMSLEFGDVPWVLQWFLLRRHRKHIFLSRGIPSIFQVRNQFDEFRWRLRWRWTLRDTQTPVVPWFRRDPAPCSRTACDPLEAWLNSVQTNLMEKACLCVSRARHSRRSWCNISALERLAMKMLRTSNYVALPNDKDQCFTLCRRDDYPRLIGSLLASPWYIPFGCWSDVQKVASKRHFELCKIIAEFECPGNPNQYARSLNRSVYQSRASAVSILRVNVKHTKSPVKLRPLHCSTFYLFGGASAWLRQQLIQKFRTLGCNHFVRDSRDFVSQLSQQRGRLLSSGGYLHAVQLDVRDFYLCGTAKDLLKEVQSVFEGESVEAAIVKVLSTLLEFQLVQLDLGHDHVSPNLYQVILGTGMGLPHSGEVADMVLYAKMEKLLLQPHIQEQFSTLSYHRFRDDILFFSNFRGPLGSAGFVSLAQSLSGYYKLKVEQMGRENIEFLECLINITDDDIVVEHRLKDNALRTLLLPSSGHPRHVHQGWPRTIIPRISSLCSNDIAFQRSLKRVLDRLISSLAHPFIIHCVSGAASKNCRRPRPLVHDDGRQTIWLTLPFHPVWSPLKSFVQEIVDGHISEMLLHAFGHPVRVNIGWRTQRTTLLSFIQRAL